jgi:hypothetical protein
MLRGSEPKILLPYHRPNPDMGIWVCPNEATLLQVPALFILGLDTRLLS